MIYMGPIKQQVALAVLFLIGSTRFSSDLRPMNRTEVGPQAEPSKPDRALHWDGDLALIGLRGSDLVQV